MALLGLPLRLLSPWLHPQLSLTSHLVRRGTLHLQPFFLG